MKFSLYDYSTGNETYLLLISVLTDSGWFLESVKSLKRVSVDAMWEEAEKMILEDIGAPAIKISYLLSTDTIEEALELAKPMMLLKGMT